MQDSPNRLRVMHAISGDLWAGAEVQAYTLLSHLKETCDLQVVLMNSGKLADELNRLQIPITIIEESHNSTLKILLQLTKKVRQFRPDIIHTHRQKENILGILANLLGHWPTRKRAASLRTLHGAPEYRVTWPKKAVVLLDQLCGNYGQDAVISVSVALSTHLQTLFPKGHIHVIQNGIDRQSLLQLVPAGDIRQKCPEGMHIGIIGRLEPVKRVDLFLQAAAYVVKRKPAQAIHFHVIGDGKLRSQLEALAHEFKLSEQVSFHGHRSDSQAAIAALDIVVMCSDHEGTPMTALEALALEKPLVAHKVGGLTEILARYPELLVSNHSAEGYGECLLRQIEQPTRTELDTRYHSEVNAMATINLYRQLVTENQA